MWSGEEEEELVSKAQQPQTEFADFSERLFEQRECCKEAVAAMQKFQSEYDTFGKWLCEAHDKHKLWTEKRAPIGVTGSELEEYYVSAGIYSLCNRWGYRCCILLHTGLDERDGTTQSSSMPCTAMQSSCLPGTNPVTILKARWCPCTRDGRGLWPQWSTTVGRSRL